MQTIVRAVLAMSLSQPPAPSCEIAGLLRLGHKHDTEAESEVVDERVGNFRPTAGRAAIKLGRIPSTAADYLDAERIGPGTSWVGYTLWVDHRSSRVRAVPILAPFPDVSFHVVQSPGIRQFLSDRVRRIPTVGAKPRKIAQLGEAGIIAMGEPRGRARARGAFPLRFGRQAITAAR